MNADAQRVEAILAEAVALTDPAARRAYLDQACANDAELRREVESLLGAHEQAGDFLEAPPTVVQEAGFGIPPSGGPGGVPAKAGTPNLERPGERIGRYKLLEPIGEGGFGTVWLAEQEEPVRRRVALKVIKLGMDTRQVVARFQAERQALALMDHPNIAKVFDGGATDTGRPYFVMELVHGVRITDYCDQHHLSTRARLELFIHVCQAVQHAHQKGVIHRDLKPSNILVTVQDERPVPKVIDFGVAKAIEGRLTDATVLTGAHQFLGTPCYMSPEQASLGRLDIDTRSDLYSLGVLLYELLTGHTPFNGKTPGEFGLDEMRRLIREKDPPRPSTRLRELATAGVNRRAFPRPQPSTHRAQRTDTADFRRRLEDVRGDLDWIVMKCLEKDRDRRYATANGLAADIQRHLNHEPVVARPPSRLYRFRKMVRRNRLPFTLVNTVAAAIAIGLGVSLWLLAREKTAHRQAHAAEQRASTSAREAHLAQARALRFSGRAGRRFEGLDALAKATALPVLPDGRFTLALRNEAIGLLALADVRPGRPLPAGTTEYSAAAIDLAGRRYALGGRDGTIALRRIADDAVIAQWAGSGCRAAALLFSPGGQFLSGKFDCSAGPDHTVLVWDATDGRLLLALTNVFRGNSIAFDFHPHQPVFAVGEGSRFLALYELAAGRLLRRLPVAVTPYCVCFSPDGERMAVSANNHPKVQILSLSDGSLVRTLSHPTGVYGLAWHPSGTMLAAGGDDHRVYLWDVDQGRQRAALPGHRGQVVRVAFSPDGERLASAGWDSALCLWEPFTEELLARTPGANILAIEPSGRSLGLLTQGTTFRWAEAVPIEVWRTLRWEEDNIVRDASFSPDGRLLALATDAGVTLCDVAANRPIARLPTPATMGMTRFTDDGRTLVVSGHAGVFAWPIQAAEEREARGSAEKALAHGVYAASTRAPPTVLRFGPPRTLPFPKRTEDICLLPGRQVAGAGAGGYSVCHLDSPGAPRHVSGHSAASRVSASPDGRWIATGAWQGPDVVIWEARARRQERILPTPFNTAVLFSPDGRWLATATHGHYTIWEAGQWTARHQFTNDAGPGSSLMSFSPDARLLAVRKSAEEVQLLDPATGLEVACLPGATLTPRCFNPDGTRLVVLEGDRRLRVWDLRRLRQELAKMNLDWELPPYPPAPDLPPPVRIEILTK